MRSTRPKVIVGNWKMFKGPSEARQTAKTIRLKLTDIRSTQVGICPPLLSVAVVLEILKGTRISTGVQNCHWSKEGAFTGEVSPPMIKDAGCKYVILGHSERRQFFCETDENVNKKLAAVINEQLTPIVCIGETLAERESGQTESVVHRQFHEALKGIPIASLGGLIIAYEPVWAIGTGKTATPEQANEVHELIRSWMLSMHGPKAAEMLTIQYGGSVKPDNAESLLSKPHIDGALVGGASLDADSFSAIVRHAEALS